MNKKAISRGCNLTHSRILTTVGVVELLFLLLLTARGDSITNLATRAFVLDTDFTRARLLPASSIPALDANTVALENQFADALPTSPTTDLLPSIVSTSGPASNDSSVEFVMSGAVSNATMLPTGETPAPILVPSVLGLEEPSQQTLDQAKAWAQVSLGWGHLMLQLFAPNPHPLPPGGSPQSDWNESDRPWPVIAAGAANRCSWNEPGLYRAQGLLSLCW